MAQTWFPPNTTRSLVLGGSCLSPCAGLGRGYAFTLPPTGGDSVSLLSIGPRTLCKNSFSVGPRSPVLTTNTDSCHGLPRWPSPQLTGPIKTDLCHHTHHHQYWAPDTCHFSWLASPWGLLFLLCFYLVEGKCPPSVRSTLET